MAHCGEYPPTEQAIPRSVGETKRMRKCYFGECAPVPPGVVYLTQWYRHVASHSVLGDGGTRWAYAGVGTR